MRVGPHRQILFAEAVPGDEHLGSDLYRLGRKRARTMVYTDETVRGVRELFRFCGESASLRSKTGPSGFLVSGVYPNCGSQYEAVSSHCIMPRLADSFHQI